LDDELVGQNIYIDILNQATDYVYIYTPYLVIDGDFMNALKMAAKRGVDVRLMTPGIPDKKIVFRVTRSYYAELMDAGVRVFEYTPGFLHAKSYVSDDRIGVIGTINMDFRSLCLHFECGVLMIDSSTILDMKEDFLQTLSKCGLVGAHSPRYKRLSALVDNAIRAFAPLM
jgi:cardiolipin synthase